MARRVVDDVGSEIVHTSHVERVPLATVIANVVTVLYAVVLTLIGLDALLTAMDANPDNGFVSAVDRLSDPLLAPFDGMFGDQRYWATALVAAVVYTIAYVVVTMALRTDRMLLRR